MYMSPFVLPYYMGLLWMNMFSNFFLKQGERMTALSREAVEVGAHNIETAKEAVREGNQAMTDALHS